MEGKLSAICPQDTEIEPIVLTEHDMARYRFSFKKLIEVVRQANGFAGNSYSLNQRVYFVGERVVEGTNTAFILALYPNVRSAEPALLSLPARIPQNCQQMVVVTPSLELTEESIYSKLRAASVFPIVLPASFGKRHFKISYLAALRKRLPEGVSSDVPILTTKQLTDYEQYGYLCRDRLNIPGVSPHKRSNVIFLNSDKVQLGDSLFALLLRFVVELKKGKGGWVSSPQLESEGLISDSAHHQPFSRLRAALKGSLKEKDGKKFIEASGSRKYRISTHPDFVTYDKGKLLRHPDPDIRRLSQ